MHSLRDLQSLAYLLALPGLVAWQWHTGFSWWFYPLLLFLTLGISVIHHNHAHLRIWKSKTLNRATDLWIALLQGHPGFVFYTAHIANHHRYNHGALDEARTYRFTTPGANGDSNHLLGYLLHPLQAVWVLYPLFVRNLRHLAARHRGYFAYCMLQYALVLGSWAALAWLDWRKWLVLVLLPQLHGLHWLLATNYLQHAHAQGQSAPGTPRHYRYARNFYGALNPLLFNIGLHTAHHERPRAHWSTLPQWDAHFRPNVPECLREPSLLGYMLRVYGLGLVSPRWRTQSLHNKKD